MAEEQTPKTEEVSIEVLQAEVEMLKETIETEKGSYACIGWFGEI